MSDVTLPHWFVIVAPYLLSLFMAIIAGAIPWAWKVQQTLTIIAAKLETNQQLTLQTDIEQTRRIEDQETRIRVLERTHRASGGQ